MKSAQLALQDNFKSAVDLLEKANIKNSDAIYLARSLAGSMLTEVGSVFPNSFAMIYVLTDYKRRQIYNAYLAAKSSEGRISDPDEFRHRLLFWRSKRLLQDGYGSIPHGFQTALERLGTVGQHPHIYKLLHRFMCDSQNHAKALQHSSRIKAQTLEFMAILPDDLRSVHLAKKFKREKDVLAFVFAVEMLSGGNVTNRNELVAKIAQTASQRGSISGVLHKEYHSTSFPLQAVPDGAHVRFISNGELLRHVARQMNNCLADNYFAEAIRGDYQFYTFADDEELKAVISIKNDRPYGWRIVEMRGPENLMIEDQLRAQIVEYFGSHQVYEMPDMETLIDGLSRSIHRDHDPIKHIEDLIDEMLVEGEAA